MLFSALPDLIINFDEGTASKIEKTKLTMQGIYIRFILNFTVKPKDKVRSIHLAIA